MENLAKALTAFQAEMPIVGKDKTADMGSYSYKYTDLGTLTETITPLLTRHGLSFVVAPRRTETGYEAVGILLHESGESIEGALPIFGRLQEMGSAISYARRYLFSALTGVVTEEDDDGKRAKSADPTPNKNWDEVADIAESLSTFEEVRELWDREGVAKAPKVIQERVKAAGDALQKEQATP